MLRNYNIGFWLLVLISWFNISAFIVPDAKTVDENQTLFKIARSKDAYEIWYSINLDQNGHLNKENPIKIFWVNTKENNQTEPLTWIQKQYAYGIKIIDSGKSGKNELNFQFVSYAKRTFTLRQTAGNHFKVYTNSNNKEIEVTWIFIQINGGTFWFPNIPQVELHGIDPLSGNAIKEIIKP